MWKLFSKLFHAKEARAPQQTEDIDEDIEDDAEEEGEPDLDPPFGKVDFGDLKRFVPVAREALGEDRGPLIDRYYIEKFMEQHKGDVRGVVLEMEDNSYTMRYGGRAVTKCEVLHLDPGNPQATIIGDLAKDGVLPEDRFDCIICTQTLFIIYDYRAAVKNLYRALKPGGVLLTSFPNISPIVDYGGVSWRDSWRFTEFSARRVFEEFFPAKNIETKTYGNIYVAVAFLHGLSAGELTRQELDYHDPCFQVMITLRARK